MFQFLSDASRRRTSLIGLLLAAVVLVLAGSAFWHARAEATASAQAATADDASGVGILLKLADGAMQDGRLVAPQGSNAYEFYFSVLELDPHNAVAQANMRKTFVRARADVEHTIDTGDLDEAQRELRLLKEYDASDYTLLLLSGKLGASRQVLAQQHEMQAELIRARTAAAAGSAN